MTKEEFEELFADLEATACVWQGFLRDVGTGKFCHIYVHTKSGLEIPIYGTDDYYPTVMSGYLKVMGIYFDGGKEDRLAAVVALEDVDAIYLDYIKD